MHAEILWPNDIIPVFTWLNHKRKSFLLNKSKLFSYSSRPAAPHDNFCKNCCMNHIFNNDLAFLSRLQIGSNQNNFKDDHLSIKKPIIISGCCGNGCWVDSGGPENCKCYACAIFARMLKGGIEETRWEGAAFREWLLSDIRICLYLKISWQINDQGNEEDSSSAS